MFCPNCKAEYREGFTECSDCQVPLVKDLSGASARGGESRTPEAPELLWSGTDSSAEGAIVEALKAARISHHTTISEGGALPGLSKPVYAILIHARDRVAARAALDDARLKAQLPENDEDKDPDDLESALPIPAEQETDDSTLAVPDYVPEDFDPNDATAEVWSGTDPAMARGLKDSLRENGIGCKITKGEAGRRLSVLPSEEGRAREIIREVVDASPPQ